MDKPFPWRCRKCQERAVMPVSTDYTADLEHDGRAYTVTVKNLPILRCSKCGAQTLPDEAFDRLYDELRRQAGILSPARIASERYRLGYMQKEFARLLGVAPETVSRWETGGQIPQRVMSDFMRVFFAVPEARDFLLALRGGAARTAEGGAGGTTAARPNG
jgi:putative zinc finger/helix-turn-helix YgiT family protein